MNYYTAYQNPYSYHQQPYFYGNQLYPTISYYGGYGGAYGGGYGYAPYNNAGYYEPNYRPNVIRRMLNRMRYGVSDPFGYPSNALGYEYQHHRYYPEQNQVSSVKDLWRSNDYR